MPRRRPNFAAIHARMDARAWKAIHDRKIPARKHAGLALSGRPANFQELVDAVEQRGQDYGFALSHFLDEFYLYRSADFFAIEPPTSLPAKQRAFLAAMTELLCREFDMPIPAWTEKPEYFLDEEWDYVTDLEEFPEQLRDRVAKRRERATAEFLRHNIIFESRGLIRL
jgi:hypothetical protein